jgi:hypothetical protein
MASQKDLALADRHIAEAEQHITRQRSLIEQLAAAGREIAQAETVLKTMLATLEQLQAHRCTILDRLASGDASKPGSIGR